MKCFKILLILLLLLPVKFILPQSSFVNTVDFDGSGDYANTFNSPYLPTPNGTIEAWVKVRSILPPGGNQGEAFLAKNEEQWNLGDFYVFFDYSSGKLKSRIQTSPSIEIDVQSNNSFGSSLEEWFHYAFTWGSNGMKMYINGLLQNNQNNLNYSALNNIYNIYVGAHGYMLHNGTYVVSDFFDGQIDELRIWNYQKNSQQILTLKDSPLDSSYYTTIDSGLVGYWKFDELEDLGINNDGVDDVRDFSVLHNHLDLAGDAHLVGSIVLTGELIVFEKSFGGNSSDIGIGIDITSDGGFIVSGSTSTFSSDQDMYLIKLDELGSVEWSKVYHSFGYDDKVQGISSIPSGGYYLSGYIEGGFGLFDHSILKVDEDGNLIWAKHFGGTESDILRDVNITNDGGAIVSGFNSSFGSGAKDAQLIKLSSNGNVEWAKTYGYFNEEFNGTNIVVSDGNYLFVGSADISGSYDIRPLLIKTDNTGNIIWAKVYSGYAEDWARFAVETSDGGFIISGDTRSYGLGGTQDIYLIKTNLSGEVEWAKAYGGVGNESGYCIIQNSEGEYVIAGYTDSFGFGANDAFLMKVDTDGSLNWFYTYGGQQNDYAVWLEETPDSGYVISGRRSSNSLGSEDVYVIKTDKSGYTSCNTTSPNVNVFNVVGLLANDYTVFTSNVISVDDLPLTVMNVNSAMNVYCESVPVELTSFSGKGTNHGVLLEWITATELNNYGFEIEKALGQTEFHTIAFIKGSGTTTETRKYSYLDNIDYNGTEAYSYRLKQIDYDGRFSYSEIITIKFDVPQNYMLEQNYPNPFNPITTIRYAIPVSNRVNIKIYDITGQLIAVLVNEVKEAGTYEINFNTEGLASGIYFYQMNAGDFFAVKKMNILK